MHGYVCVLQLFASKCCELGVGRAGSSFTSQHIPWRQGTKTSLAKPGASLHYHYHHPPYCVGSNQRSMKLMSLECGDFKAKNRL
jgi:hypothetical protein